ncbi:Six-bladed beta-propeller, TolB-like [Sergentomyia squamirostris]
MRVIILPLLFLFLLCFTIILGVKNGVEEMYYWKEVKYENLPLPDDTYIGEYPYHTPNTNDILGLGYHAESGLMIATVSRLRSGVPSTLNAFCTTDYPKGSSPKLWGFPSYERNMIKESFYENTLDGSRSLDTAPRNYSAAYYDFFFKDESDVRKLPSRKPYHPKEDYTIISTYHPAIDDRCSRLFILDTGLLHYSATVSYVVQDPAIIVFELPSNACKNRKFPVVRRVEIPSHLYTTAVGLLYITLDFQHKGTCNDLFLYITNLFDYTVIVYDYKLGKFSPKVFAAPTMKPILAESTFYFKDYQLQIPAGITDVVLGWLDKEGNRNAYFAPLSSIGEYSVSTKTFKDFKEPYNPKDFRIIGYRGCNSQTYIQVIDRSIGVIYFGEVNSKRVRCWNICKRLTSDNLGVVFESEKLHFISSMILDADGYLWFITDQLPVIFLTTDLLNVTEVNSRTFRVKSSEAVRGTVCDKY